MLSIGFGAEILSCCAPFISFVPGYADGVLAEVLCGSMHGSTQEAVTTTRHITEVFALQAILNGESIGVVVHVWGSIHVKLLGDETRRVPAR